MITHLNTAMEENGNRKVNADLYAKNLNLGVMYRILQVLEEKSPVKVTNLAMYSRMNHIVCKKYLNTMSKLGWIEIQSHNDNTLFKLSEMGIKIQSTLNFVNQT